MKRYEEIEKIDILSEKAAGFFANLNKFQYDKNLKDFKKDIQDNLVMSGQEISDDVAGFLHFIIKIVNPKKILELGTFAGFSTLIIARACSKDFSITTIDVNEEPALIGKKYWKNEGFESKIHFVKARASEVLEGDDEIYDFIFIDADKKGTEGYLDLSLKKLSENGMIVVDNIWLGGSVINPTRQMHQARIDFLKSLEAKTGINKTFIPVGDGLLLISKE